jgi:hypothetical protein
LEIKVVCFVDFAAWEPMEDKYVNADENSTMTTASRTIAFVPP